MHDPKFIGNDIVRIPDGRLGRVYGAKMSASDGDKEFLYTIITLDGEIIHDISEHLLVKVTADYKIIQVRDFGKTLRYSGALSKDIYIKKVIYNNPATIILWSDGTKTSSKCDDRDSYNPELGLTIAFLKKLYGSDSTVKLLEEWAPEEPISKLFPKSVSLTDIRRKQRHANEK